MFGLNFSILKSKTIWAALAAAAGLLLAAVSAGEPITIALVLKAIGIVLGAIGVRDALGGPTAANK